MNLLVTGAWNGAEAYLPALEAMGHSVAFLPQEKDLLPCSYEWVEGLIGNGLFLYHPLERFRNLRFIQLTSAGLERVPLSEIRTRRIELHSARGVYSVPMAEFALSGVLQLYKQAAFFRENQKRHRWEKHRGLQELAGRTVCVVGCGSVGTECARRFAAFGCRVIGVATSAREQAFFDEVVTEADLNDILPEADVLVLALPLTERTAGLIGTERLSRMKPSSVLVNIARGAIVDETALLSALTERRLQGAVLDVFEEEPLPDSSPLWDMDNVILTPHNSFVGEGNGERLSARILGNLERSKP